MAYLARSAVAVVGETFYYNRNAVRAVAFIYAVFVVVFIPLARSFFNKTVDVVVRDIVSLRFCDKGGKL